MSEETPIRIVAMLAESEDAGDNKRWHTILTTDKTFPSPMGDKRGPFKFTTADLEQMVANHDGEKPIDIHHATARGSMDPAATKARGWIEKLRVVGNALQALCRWTDEGAEMIKTEAFRYFSAEPGKVRDKASGKERGWSITAGTLTNRPVFSLPAFVLSEAAYHDLEPNAGGATVEPAENPSGSDNHVGEKETPMSDETMLAEVADLKAEVAKLSEARTALEGELTAAREDAVKAAERVATIEGERKVEKLLMSGRIDVSEKDAALTCYQKDADLFETIFASREKGSRVPVGETGEGRADETEDDGIQTFDEAHKKLVKLSEARAKENSSTPEDEMGYVLSHNPDIAAIYLAGEGEV